ncbi:MAG: tripartite tricarboxylate transporter substrate binding protein [Betaproteobacteria bacterium]|nr:tripartite tricarboxylate transporter substrate binding protein [Betaproteobacteria bacterium]
MARQKPKQKEERMRSCLWLVLMACAGTCYITANAHAQNYPDRPVRLVVGFPPGGAADIIARIVGQKLSEGWGQQVVVDNRPGAGSTIGAEITARAAPNGYTLLMISSSHAASAGLYKTSYMPVDSFAPVTLVASTPQALLANPSLAAKSVNDLLAMAKGEPGKLSYGSAGNGSTTHLAGELLTDMAKVKMVHVPYKGGAPALADLMGGQIQLMFLALPPALPQIKSGKVRALAVTSLQRSPSLPQVQAISEVVPGYEATNWYGVLAPKDTPAPIIKKLHADMVTVLGNPDVARSIVSQGADIVGSTPQEFTSYLRAEIDKCTKVIKIAGIRSD